MHYARQLLLLTAMALVATALTAAPAPAQGVTVLEEESVNFTHDCADLLPPAGMYGQVTGGCNVEFISSAGNALAQILRIAGVGELERFSCEIWLEARLDSNAEGYVSEFDFWAPHDTGICTRRPCDDRDGETEPWPLQITEDGFGREELGMTLCLRLASAGPGGAQSFCEIHAPLHDLGSHNYEVELDNASCEANPPGAVVEFRGHLLSDPEAEGEQIELLH